MRESWIDFKILSTMFPSPISSEKSETIDDIVNFTCPFSIFLLEALHLRKWNLFYSIPQLNSQVPSQSLV